MRISEWSSDVCSSDLHPQHQLGSDRRATCAAVERLQLRSHAVEIEMAVNPAQQVVCRNVIIEAEVVEELCRSRLTSHHRSTLRKSCRALNHAVRASAMAGLFNRIRQTRS